MIGYVALWAFEQCLQEEKHGKAFTEAINTGAADILSQARGFLTITLRPDETNLDALRQMQTHHLEALVVADTDGQLKGIVGTGGRGQPHATGAGLHVVED